MNELAKYIFHVLKYNFTISIVHIWHLNDTKSTTYIGHYNTYDRSAILNKLKKHNKHLDVISSTRGLIAK